MCSRVAIMLKIKNIKQAYMSEVCYVRGKKAVIRATSHKIIDSIKHYLFWVSTSQDLSVFLLK